MRKFWKSTDASIAIEAAILMPIFIGMCFAMFCLWQLEQLSGAVNFSSQASAAAAARILAKGGDNTAVIAAAKAAFDANKVQFILGAQATQVTTVANGLVTTTVHATATPLLNVAGFGNFDLTSAASD